MTNLNRIFASLFCLVSLVSMANASGSPEAGPWSNWIHDEHVLPELYLRSRCVQDPTNAKKALWEIQFDDVGSALVEVKGKDWKYEVPSNQQVGPAHVEAKNCSKPLELKMDGRVPVKNYDYKLTYKDQTLTVKPHEHVDWGSWVTAGIMGAAAMTQTMAQNDAQIAEIQAQQQAEQQAAAQARALQVAQLQAAYAQQRAAQQQAQAALAEQAAAQRAAQAAQQQSQLAAQQAANQRAAQATTASQSAYRDSVSNSGSAYSGSRSSSPQPQPRDLSISQNYTDNFCNNGVTVAHYQLSNDSYSNAQMTVELDYQVGGVTTSFTETHTIGPRTSNDYSRQIQCGDPQLSDFGGRSTILQFQFY
jgi:hypothetical protein